ncbi:MAG TPA: RloB domain-containing protein, partial [Polyangiaceae bacterium]|nr:RloB domain-containing protein [Polyangiaceae bacterium]
LWLLLHFTDDVAAATTAGACERALRAALGGSYNKSNLRADTITVERVDDAVARAERLDQSPAEPWPTAAPATRVYRVMQSIRPPR